MILFNFNQALSIKKVLLIIPLSAAILVASAQSTVNLPAPSPKVKIVQRFSTSEIVLDYSRPSMKGRSIFGNMIPYGQVWRTGANECTKITFNEKIAFGGMPIPAGTYALYSVPGKDSWQIILNSGIKNWGDVGFTDSLDVAKVTVPVQQLSVPVETFNIGLEDITDTSCNLALSWEKVKVTVPIVAHNDSLITAYLENALAGSKPPYGQAAQYYLSKNKRLNEALTYSEKAVAANPKAFGSRWLHARILYKLNRKQEALDEAKQAANLAKGTPFAYEYQRDYENMKSGKM